MVCCNYPYDCRLQQHVLSSPSAPQCCASVPHVSQVHHCSWLPSAADCCLCNTQELRHPESTLPGTCKHKEKSYFCFINLGEGTEFPNPFHLHIRHSANDSCCNIRSCFSQQKPVDSSGANNCVSVKADADFAKTCEVGFFGGWGRCYLFACHQMSPQLRCSAMLSGECDQEHLDAEPGAEEMSLLD